MGRKDRFQAAEKYSEKMWQLQVQLFYWSLHSFNLFFSFFASKITQFKQQANIICRPFIAPMSFACWVCAHGLFIIYLIFF